MAPARIRCLLVPREPIHCCLPALVCPPAPFLSSSLAMDLSRHRAGNSAARTRYITIHGGAGGEKVCKESALPPGLLWYSLLSAPVLKRQGRGARNSGDSQRDVLLLGSYTRFTDVPDLDLLRTGEGTSEFQPMFLPSNPSCSHDWASPSILIHVKFIPWGRP